MAVILTPVTVTKFFQRRKEVRSYKQMQSTVNELRLESQIKSQTSQKSKTLTAHESDKDVER